MEEIKRCSNCGKPIIDKFAFCPFCGKELEPKCKNCGEPIVEGAKFCSKCGARIESCEEHAKSEQPQVQTSVCAPVVEKEKAKGRNAKHSTKGILTLVKRSVVALVCLLMFALSFAGVLNLSLEKYLDGILDSAIDDDFIEGDVSLYSVDCIELMFATARHYDEDKDVAKIEKLADELTDLEEDLYDSLSDDVRGTKIVLSKESENLLRKYVVKTLAYQLSVDGSTTSGAVNAEIITAGTLFLLNILFTFVMAIIAIVAFAKYLGDFLQGKEDDKHAKLDFFVPLLMILPLCAMLPFSTAIGAIDVAGAMIASLFFASLAIVVCLTQRFVSDAKAARTAKILVPRIATLVFAFIVVGCCFAPCFKVVYDVQLSGKTAAAKYETTLNASAMAGCITGEEEQKSEYYRNQYERYTDQAIALIEQLDNFKAKDFMANDELIAKAYAQLLLVDGVLAQISYDGANMLSLGFFLLILVMVISGFYLGGTIVGGESAKAANTGLSVAILVLLLFSFALSVATMEIANNTMDEIKTDAFELQLAGGLIAAIIMSIVMIVFDSLPSKIWKKRESEISDFATENN